MNKYPTDRNGDVYYGPKTFEAAREQINFLVSQGEGTPQDVAAEVADRMEAAGYAVGAEKVRTFYEIA